MKIFAILALCLLIGVCLFFACALKNNQAKSHCFSFNEIISSIIKNRKMPTNIVKNGSQNGQKIKTNDIIRYKKLSNTRLTKPFLRLTKNTNKTYVEQNLEDKTSFLISLSSMIEDKINKSKVQYRAIKGECLIETVANSYAHKVLVSTSFNMFENFKNLTRLFKVYKKEAEVLNILVINELMKIYLKLSYDLRATSKCVMRASRLNFAPRKMTPAVVYGIYKFNPKASAFNLDQKQVISSTTFLLNELDQIAEKQRIIYNYIIYLYKGLK